MKLPNYTVVYNLALERACIILILVLILIYIYIYIQNNLFLSASLLKARPFLTPLLL